MIFIQVCKKNSQSRLPYLWPTTDRSALNESNLSSPKQFGLISGRSTVTDILVNWGSRRCYYLDFAKVFDTVPHLKLFGKPISFVINRKILKRLSSGIVPKLWRSMAKNHLQHICPGKCPWGPLYCSQSASMISPTVTTLTHSFSQMIPKSYGVYNFSWR